MNSKNSFKLLCGISLMFLLLFSQTSNVAAANNQGLEWGVAIGNRIDFDVKISYQNTTLDLEIDDEMYVIIDDLPSIPDDISSFNQITTLNMILGYYSTFWDNGSSMDRLWTSDLKMTPFTALPVGNWVLVTQLFQDASPTAVIVQDGTIFNFTVEDLPNPDNIQSTELLKSDGATSSRVYNVTWGSETTTYVELTRTGSTTSSSTTTSTTTTTTSGTTTGSGLPFGDTTLLIIIGGVAVVAVILILVILRKR